MHGWGSGSSQAGPEGREREREKGGGRKTEKGGRRKRAGGAGGGQFSEIGCVPCGTLTTWQK